MAKKDTLFDKLTYKDDKSGEKYHNLRINILTKLLILFTTVVIISLFFNYHLEEENYDYKRYSYTAGYVWSDDPIIAEFDFAINRPLAEYKEDLNAASLSTERVFSYDKEAYDEVLYNIDTYLTPSYFNPDSNIFNNSAISLIDTMSQAEKKQTLNLVKKYLIEFVAKVYDKGLIDIPKSEIDLDIVLAESDSGDRALIKKNSLYDKERFDNAFPIFIITEIPRLYSSVASDMADYIFIPNLLFSQTLTSNRENELRNAVPKTKGIVRAGETIIEKGIAVTAEDLEKLHSYQNMRFLLGDENFSITTYLGSVGHTVILISIFFIYLFILRKKIFYNNFYVAMICLNFIFIAFLSWLTVELSVGLPIEYLILLPAASMLAAIILDSRTAFYLTVSLSLMVAGIRGNDYMMGLVMLVTGSIAAYTVRDIQNRTQIYQSIFFIFISLFFTISIFAMEWSEDLMTWVLKLGVALLNAVISPLLTFGILYLLDKYSPITTDLKLEEYDDLNHPLLSRMNEVAPGTYQHSLGVASLAERCASAIGANQLYCKVTSLYHDIGKLERPEYFVENQIDLENKHDLIQPRKSAQIIIEHVTHGARLANEYKLPENIIDIIMSHHGTTMVGHFYAKEVEVKGIDNVDKEDFTYPGPIPKSKEAVIIMICDAAEAMSRISTKTRSELEQMVEKIILDRIREQQFVNSDITTHELHTIKDTIVKNLVAKSHKRVEYKTTEKRKED
jgi:putative nucleotidyltransferase with HDIG domain